MMFAMTYLSCHLLNLKKDFQTCHTNLKYLHEKWTKLDLPNAIETWTNFSIFSQQIQIVYAESLFRHENFKTAYEILQGVYNELKRKKDNSNVALRQDVAQKIISLEDFLQNS